MKINPFSESKELVSQYLQFYANKKTQENYKNAIYQYLSQIYDDIKPNLASLNSAAAKYLTDLSRGRTVIVDLRTVAAKFVAKYTPLTGNLNLTFVCAWLEFYGFNLQKRERQRIFSVFSPIRSIREEAELTRSLFRKIYAELPKNIGVLLIVLLGSGMRIGEAMSLNKSDIEWKSSRPVIHIRAEITKTKMDRITFLTSEASVSLSQYLANRDDNDERVFPFSKATAQYHFRKAADKLGYNTSSNKPRLIHWHMTRKWFISRFSLYANKEVAENLVGHEGYLAKSYQRFTKKQLLSQFKRAEKYLILFPGNQIES